MTQAGGTGSRRTGFEVRLAKGEVLSVRS